MLGNRRIDEFVDDLTDPVMGALLVGFHQAAVTGYIGGQNCREPALTIAFDHFSAYQATQ